MEYKLPKDYKKPDKFKQVEFDQFNHELYNSPTNFCNNCGAKMDEEEEE